MMTRENPKGQTPNPKEISKSLRLLQKMKVLIFKFFWRLAVWDL
jgi:hypothetical protein